MPRRLLRSATAVALATSASGLAYVGTAAPAQAAGYDGYCKTSSGVTIVVDFKALGGGILVRCSPVGGGSTGLKALSAAGIPVDMVQRQPGFVCRLYGKPAKDPCVNTPPATAYWSYWKASNGGSWGYSNVGAGGGHVTAGGFEGWAFSDGSKVPPGVAPSRPAPQPTHTPKPTHTTTQPAPPRHTTTTAPRHTTTTAPQHGSSGHGTTQPRSTATSTDSSAATSPSRSATGSGSAAKHRTQHPKKSTKHSKKATKTSHSSTSTPAGSAAGGPSSSGKAFAAGAGRIGNSDKRIEDSKKSSSINATTAVGGGVLGLLAIGGAAVAIVRRRNLG